MTVTPHIRFLRFAVSLRRRADDMNVGLHSRENMLAMRLAATAIAELSRQVRDALAVADAAVNARDAA
jgi:hypothetical protein